jgi:hypothetical protein
VARDSAPPPWAATGSTTLLGATYALGGISLAGEAAVHAQQYFSLYHEVRWIGPLFLANAVACVTAIAALTYPRARELAAWAGIVISVAALGGLVISYGEGLFGWQEAGFRAAVALVLIFEAAAVILLSAALAAAAGLRRGEAT